MLNSVQTPNFARASKANHFTGSYDVHAFEYFGEREIFAPTERFGSNGLRNFLISTDTTILEFAKPELIEAVHNRVNCQLLSYVESSKAPKNIDSVFVEPILSTKSYLLPSHTDNKQDSTEATNFRLPELLQQEARIVLIGQRECGKTTLVNYVATNWHKFHLPVVITACVIDCGRLRRRATQAGIFELATHFFSSHVAIRDVKKLSSQGQILFCFDGVYSDDMPIIKLLLEFINSFPQNRYLITATESIRQSIYSQLLPNGEASLSIQSLGKPVYIHNFRRKHTKELVHKWFGVSKVGEEDRIDKVATLLKKLGVPRTPFLVSLVLWVLENMPSADLINQAAVLEAMVDGLLGKLTESKGRTKLDARLKTLFLMDFAFALYSQNEHRFDRVYVEKFIAEYFSTKGWKESSFELLNELLDKGLLIQFDGQIEFKFDCFRAFFLGKKLNEDAEFFAQAITRDKFTELRTEIDFATGLARNRKDYLDNIFHLCKQISSEINKSIDIALLDNAKSNSSLFNGKVRSQLEKNITQVDADGNHREAVLNRMDEINEMGEVTEIGNLSEAIQIDKIPDEFKKQIELLEGLITLSVVIRNSEALYEADKNEPLIWLVHSVASIITDDYASIDSHHDLFLKHANGNIDDAKKAEHMMKLLPPVLAIQIFSDNLVTPKLGKLFEGNYISAQYSIEKLVYLCCMLKAQTESCIDHLGSFFTTGQRHTLLKEVAYFFGTHALTVKKWSPKDINKLKDVLIDFMASMAPIKKNMGINRNKMHAQLDNRIRQSELDL